MLHIFIPSLSSVECSVDTDISYRRNKLVIYAADVVETVAPTIESSVFDEFFESHVLPDKLEKKIVKLIKKNRIIYGSDATFDKGYGAFAWRILDKDNNNNTLVKYHSPLHGCPSQNHSTRGELFGILGCLRHISYLHHKYKFPVRKKVRVYIYTDSSASISILKGKNFLSTSSAVEDDYDIKAEVRHAYRYLHSKIDVRHVRAHQDDKVAFKHLSHASKLNVLMDRFASLALTTSTKIRYRPVIPHLPQQKISYRSPFERLTRKLASELNRGKIGHAAECYLKEKWNFDDNAMKTVLWKELGTVLQSVPFYKRVQYARIMHKQWATMKRNCAWGFTESDKCPICSKAVEDRKHILSCRDPLSIAFRNKQILGLRASLQKIHTNPFITNHIIRSLYQYHGGYNISLIPIRPTMSELEKLDSIAINDTITLGMDNFLSAVVTKSISDAQHRYIIDHGLSNVINITGWNKGVIRIMFEYTNSIWLYRSSILHEKKELNREAMIRQQAVDLLFQLRRNPYKLHYSGRDLSARRRSDIMNAPLSRVLNWIDRVSVALDKQSKNAQLGTSDIRRWLHSDLHPSKTHANNEIEKYDDGFYVHGCYVDYDSDATLSNFDRYPDEQPELMTWVCDKNCCVRLRDRFGIQSHCNCLSCMNEFFFTNNLPSSSH